MAGPGTRLTCSAGYSPRSQSPVAIYFHWRPQLCDADDEMVLDAAFAGSVKAIVTHNVEDFLPAANSFGVRIFTPSEFVQEGKA